GSQPSGHQSSDLSNAQRRADRGDLRPTGEPAPLARGCAVSYDSRDERVQVVREPLGWRTPLRFPALAIEAKPDVGRQREMEYRGDRVPRGVDGFVEEQIGREHLRRFATGHAQLFPKLAQRGRFPQLAVEDAASRKEPAAGRRLVE